METKLCLFSAFGVELEYMIVNRENLSVSPISDQLIFDVTGQFENEVEFEHIAWSNELVLHVIELKTNGPAKSLEPLASYFQHEIEKINHLLEKYNAKLLPTGSHPLMNPYSEAKLWPHGHNIIYETYHKIFDCRGHGWSNLQVAHLNLPFANDSEFSKLHTAIRLILPIIPALSASTPIIDGKLTGLLDTRLEYYRLNQNKIPSVTGQVIPEVVHSQQEYFDRILKKMYQDISAYDPDKILQEEWLNSRGAIARFDRNTIEIRVIDTQECPKADLAIASFIVVILKGLIEERWQPFSIQASWPENRLQSIFLETIKYGLNTFVQDEEYPAIFGISKKPLTVRELLKELLGIVRLDLENENSQSENVINLILTHGNLAQRIVAATFDGLSLERILAIYQRLANCLQKGELFLP